MPGTSTSRLRLLLGLLLILTCVAVGRWMHERWTGPLPELPVIALADADPEVAKVIGEARAAVQSAPRSAEAWAKLATLLDAHTFVNEAITCYTAAGTLDGKNLNWPYLLANLFQKGQNPEKALPHLQRAADLAPSQWPMPRLQLADLLLALGRSDEAEQEFHKVLAADAKNGHARFGLAQVYIARRKYQDSLRWLDAVADDAHFRKRACELKAAVHERLGNHQDAEHERRRLAALPDDLVPPDLFHMLDRLRVGLLGRIQRANLLRENNEHGEARSLMEQTVLMYPGSDQAWLALSVARKNTNDFAGATRALEKCIQLAPERGEHRCALGELLQSRQRYKEAAAAFRKASELRPVHANTYFKLGDCLQAQGDNTGAAEAYRKALQYNPDLNEARRRLEKISGISSTQH